jgi:uncharacterized protein (TIGR04255 family)
LSAASAVAPAFGRLSPEPGVRLDFRAVMLPDLKNPPIVEVVCGLVFQPLPELDQMLLGHYWSTKRASYPGREIHPPVRSHSGLMIHEGVAPLRAWLIDKTEQFVIQVQSDRFYFNWRRRRGNYPRFGDHEGGQGVLTRTLSEFDEFCTYCKKELGQTPKVATAEMAKIDIVHYADIFELEKLIPAVAHLRKLTASAEPDISMQVGERYADTDIVVTVSNAVVTPALSTAVRVETRASRALGISNERTVFEEMNRMVNNRFKSLFSTQALDRFQQEVS